MKLDQTEILIDGAGPESIVMIHGWPDTAGLWDLQVATLSTDYRCIRFTLPGVEPGGRRRSYSAEDIVEFIRRVVEQASGGTPVTLMLHDWGCFYGYLFAARYPELVTRIIGVDIGDAGSRRHRRELTLPAKFATIAYQFWLAAAWRIGGRLGDWMARLIARVARAPGDHRRVRAQMGYPYYVQWARWFRGERPGRMAPHCPLLFLYGKRKPFHFHSKHWASELAAKPGCRVIGLDTGHWVMVQAPEQFNREVIAWLAHPAAADARAG